MPSDSILVFREQEFYFGISPSDFGPALEVDQLEIASSGVSEAIWHYKSRDPQNPLEGIFLHLGALFGLKPIDFSHKGRIYLNQLDPETTLGLFVDNLTLQIPKEALAKHLTPLTEVSKLPPELPPRAIRQVIKYNRKKILLIDPVRLSEVYQLIAPERVRNLLRLFHEAEPKF
ncbi:MAG: hypothetical protein A2600_10150 [Candidatus Lambdaproteobacteria bacterium RIFOXYD1_FULL_56_27]|uniref:CheW-like domain-containing protein n=1 Tax=Candidatus Lambdaproteobacteria bacterium RIFOXYD2_FULL_56_26 TaxID=1817773 RepID=A0A1F6H1X9_9PROT|nr:MAG: hypothetical protein A2426_12310 [Candidatus Lambdaproteobacteria bacterium RIFOXYC1_FULL_56_13]OGH04346.1 MAG: hypothetical protein A2557_10890 [Candidatus Lambdaproteobacteria bacterium RIFOXYD2_FULL_56_26]OGH08679.1 MAG: hypothetical protein A2600_10150 [Candidatus Lambdaproteobacteria bacterium RIFOXYD1_FULL_56_27]